jgi:hypothetical protein
MKHNRKDLVQSLLHLGGLLRTYEHRLPIAPGVGVDPAHAQIVTGPILFATRETENTLYDIAEPLLCQKLRFSPSEKNAQDTVIRGVAYVLHAQLFPAPQCRTTLLHDIIKIARIVALNEEIGAILDARRIINRMILLRTLCVKQDVLSWEPVLSLHPDLMEYFLGNPLPSLPRRPKLEEITARDRKIWKLAAYQESRGWLESCLENCTSGMQARYAEFKRLVVSGEMTLPDLELSVISLHNADVMPLPPPKLFFAEQPPTRTGHCCRLETAPPARGTPEQAHSEVTNNNEPQTRACE